jgi:FkbM family methyltransferase
MSAGFFIDFKRDKRQDFNLCQQPQNYKEIWVMEKQKHGSFFLCVGVLTLTLFNASSTLFGLDEKMIIFNEGRTQIYKPHGLCFMMKANNPTADWILDTGIPEKSLIEWCKTQCDKTKIFVDIGAHMGTYALSLAPFCKEVHAFECQRMTYYQLCAGIALNGYENIQAYNFALSKAEDNEKMLSLKIISEDGGGSSIRHLPTNEKFLKEEQVKVRSLDSFHLENIGFIKIDVEGAEIDVLKGAEETLKRSGWPSFIFEAWPDAWYAKQKEELFSYIKNLGYTLEPIPGYPQMFLARKKTLG